LTGPENREKFSSILGNIDLMLESNQESINGIVTHLDSTMAHFAVFTQWVSTAIIRFDKILTNTQKITDEIAANDLQMLITDLNEAVIQANNAFKHIDLTILKSRQDLLQSLEMFKETTEYLNEFSRQISEDPSLLLRTKKK
jgi:phospholipid/cholesterol/gamma-HCH transport system substrate-binding protein